MFIKSECLFKQTDPMMQEHFAFKYPFDIINISLKFRYKICHKPCFLVFLHALTRTQTHKRPMDFLNQSIQYICIPYLFIQAYKI